MEAVLYIVLFFIVIVLVIRDISNLGPPPSGYV